MLINDSLSTHTQTETIICLTSFSVRLGTTVKKKVMRITADYVVLVTGCMLTHLGSPPVQQQKSTI